MLLTTSGNEEALPRDLALAAIGMLAFLILALTSYLQPATGFAVCAAGIVLAAILDKGMIWALALFLIPFLQIFAFPASDMQILIVLALVAAAIRFLPLVLPNMKIALRRSSYTWILLFFFLLVVLHFQVLTTAEITGAGLLAVILILLLSSRHLAEAQAYITTLTAVGMIGGGLIVTLLSAIFTYLPLPHLAINTGMPSSLRLGGICDGPNAASRYLLAAFAFSLAYALLDKTRQRRWIALLLVSAVLLVSTQTKAGLGAAVLVCLLAVALVSPALRGRAVLLSLAAFLGMLLWLIGVMPSLERHAGVEWLQLGDKYMYGFSSVQPHYADIAQVVKNELRIGVSTQMTMNPVTGAVEYTKTSHNMWDTGQRDHVWKAGLETIRAHPWWGIGYKTWQQEMMRRLQYPFRGPHNGFLEVTGAYGVLGGVLYLLLALMLARNLLRVRRHLHANPNNPQLLWVTLAPLAWFTAEMVDVSTSLAVTLCAVWFWVLLGLQEGLLKQQSALS